MLCFELNATVVQHACCVNSRYIAEDNTESRDASLECAETDI